jgi:hypothetical protein
LQDSRSAPDQQARCDRKTVVFRPVAQRQFIAGLDVPSDVLSRPDHEVEHRGEAQNVRRSVRRVAATDLPTLAAAACVLLVVIVGGCAVPAWGASTSDPVATLRAD